MIPVFGYIRVSTVKQGTGGSSLQEQTSAIKAYAARNGLEIREWFEEKETAAKRGRPVFDRMLKLLARRSVSGVIIHKIDRSARNLRDWADLGELVDRGVQVHLAHESLDLKSRGGRLAADVQAVVAADFIRNLRDEVRKGFEGRLKQGLYPLPAPIGYRDQGRGQPKIPDPVMAPLVRQVFELYASGQYSLMQLGQEAFRLGLRNRGGGRVTRNGLSTLLNNSFYAGVIHIKQTGERYQGIHEPLVTMTLFKSVQEVLRGRTPNRGGKHNFLFRRSIRCLTCNYCLIGERQKGHIYYRCHTPTCPPTSLRETDIDRQIRTALGSLALPVEDQFAIEQEFRFVLSNSQQLAKERVRSEKLRLEKVDAMLERLTDGFLDGTIERHVYLSRKANLLEQRKLIEESVTDASAGNEQFEQRLRKYIELLMRLSQSQKLLKITDRCDLAKLVTSNLRVDGKKLVVDWKMAVWPLANSQKLQNGRPYRDEPRSGAKLPDGPKSEMKSGVLIAQQIIKALESDSSLDNPISDRL